MFHFLNICTYIIDSLFHYISFILFNKLVSFEKKKRLILIKIWGVEMNLWHVLNTMKLILIWLILILHLDEIVIFLFFRLFFFRCRSLHSRCSLFLFFLYRENVLHGFSYLFAMANRRQLGDTNAQILQTDSKTC